MRFRLHEKARRRLGLTAFVLVGVLPTLGIGAWCVWRHLPGHVEAEAARLSALLGLDVKLVGVEYPRPGTVLYESVELADPETARTILRCRLLEVASQWRTDERGRRRPVLALTASQPEIEAAGLDAAWRWLDDLLRRRLGRAGAEVHFAAAELSLHAADGSQTFVGIDGLAECGITDSSVLLRFRLVGQETLEPARLRLVRDRRIFPPQNRFELDTGGGQLPCSLLAMGLGELRALGPQCRFRGRLWADESPDGWNGEVAGQLVELDLDRLVSAHFPHHLSGMGRVTVQSAQFRQGRLVEADATLTAGPGTIDRTLVEAAVARLGLAPGAELTEIIAARAGRREVERIAYRQLGVSFALDAGRIRLAGRCDGGAPGVILSDGRGCLLAAPSAEPRPVSALVQTLVPENLLQVPASRQTDWLLRHLPVPDLLAPARAAAVRTAHLRVRDSVSR